MAVINLFCTGCAACAQQNKTSADLNESSNTDKTRVIVVSGDNQPASFTDLFMTGCRLDAASQFKLQRVAPHILRTTHPKRDVNPLVVFFYADGQLARFECLGRSRTWTQ